MLRARDLRAVLAAVIVCWAVAEGGAQESGEVAENLGNSYLLARRATSQGSIIETLLYGGRAIVTEIVVPGPAGPAIPGTTGAAPVAGAAGGASAVKVDTANRPLGVGPGFGGTLLSGEMFDGYLILHRTRANGPVTHEIFRDGDKVGSVTEVGISVGDGRPPGRNSFAFESTADRFVVHLTQPDGTKIHATSEHGRFAGQVVERAAAVVVMPPPAPLPAVLAPVSAPPSTVAAAPPFAPLSEPVKPSTDPAPVPRQRLAKPHEPDGRIMREEPQIISEPPPPRAASAPRAVPRRQPSSAAAPAPVQAASPSLLGALRSTSAPTNAPVAKPKPTVATVNVQSPPAAAAKPVGQAARPPRSPAPSTSNPQITR